MNEGRKTTEWKTTIAVLVLCAGMAVVALIQGESVSAAIAVAIAAAKALGYDWARAAVKGGALELARSEAVERTADKMLELSATAARVGPQVKIDGKDAMDTLDIRPPQR